MIKFLFEKKNVVGVAEDKDRVNVFVTKKYDTVTAQKLILDKDVDFWSHDLVPEFVKKLFTKKKTKVIEVGEIKAQVDRAKYRPVLGGCEIGIKDENFVGTAGGLVYKRKKGGLQLYGAYDSFIPILKKWGIPFDEEKFILTNCHVAMRNVLQYADEVYVQPGVNGGVIGGPALTKVMRKDVENDMDAALIRVSPSITVLPTQVPSWDIKGVRTKQLTASDVVKKYGRTTKLTVGTLSFSKATISVDYGDAGLIKVKDVLMFSGMSEKGDSGSLILDSEDKLVGLLFAGSSKYTFAIPIDRVFKYFKLSGYYE